MRIYKERRVFQVVVIGLLLLNVVGLVVLVIIAISPVVFQPLGDFPMQTIVAPRDDTGIPMVHLSDKFIVTNGTKCSNLTYPINVTGSKEFRKEEGYTVTIIPILSGGGLQQPGCLTRTFNNAIPDSMTPGLWKLRGIEIAAGDILFLKGVVTQSKPWETEYFRVLP